MTDESLPFAADPTLVGTWDLVSWESRYENRPPAPATGKKPAGRIIYTADGFMSATIMRDRHPALGVNPETLRKSRLGLFRPAGLMGLFRYLKAASDYVSYAGTYRLVDNMVFHYVDISLLPDWIGSILMRSWTLEGDCLILRAETPYAKHILTWRRYTVDRPVERIAVIGGGSVGGVVTALLAHAGHDVEMIDSNAEHVMAVNEEGLHLEGVDQVTAFPRALLPSQLAGTYDLVLLAVKAPQNMQALEPVRGFLSKEAPVVVFQNGMTADTVGRLVGPERVIDVSVGWGATYGKPGFVRHTSRGNLVLGELDGSVRDRTRRIADILRVVSPVEISTDIVGQKWSKLLINAAMSGTGTLCGFTYGEVLDHPHARKVALAALTEGARVAAAKGIKLGRLDGHSLHFLVSPSRFRQALAELFIRIGMARYRDLKASMWQDLEKGLPTEIDLLNGYLFTQGQSAGVETPVNQAITEAIHRMESGTLRPDAGHLEGIPLPRLSII